MLYRHQLRPMVSPQTKVTLYRHNLRPCTATNQGQIVSPHTKSKLYRKNLSQNCLIFYHCWGTRDNEWQGLSRSNWMFQDLYNERLNLHSLFWDFLIVCLWFFVPLEIFLLIWRRRRYMAEILPIRRKTLSNQSIIWRRQNYRWRVAKFDLCSLRSTLMDTEQPVCFVSLEFIIPLENFSLI